MKRSRINPISARRRREMRELSKSIKIIRERSGGRCEACLVLVPFLTQSLGTMTHHKRMQSQATDHSPENLLWVCPNCHDWIHHNVARAARLGLLIMRKEIA